MARLEKLTPHLLDEDQQRLYAAITAGPRSAGPQHFQLVDAGGGLAGPFNAMLLRPELGSALQALGAALRYQGALPGRARELAILVVASHWECEFEQHAHEPAGRALGLQEADLAALRAGHEPDLPDAVEHAVVRAAWALTRTGDLTEEQYTEAVHCLGQAGIFELTTLVGYYATLALQLRVFQVGLPDQ
jgi:4-carboxymuconolactone decarboxylase